MADLISFPSKKSNESIVNDNAQDIVQSLAEAAGRREIAEIFAVVKDDKGSWYHVHSGTVDAMAMYGAIGVCRGDWLDDLKREQ